MDVRLEDRVEIADLMTGRMHRDLREWDERPNLFRYANLQSDHKATRARR